jgi:DNA polymerase-3 subunit alpha
MLEGNKEKGRTPVKTFINELSHYPGLEEIIRGISGLINKRGVHASGVIMFDEDPYEFSCFMRTPSGEVITQYDLHMAEAAGMTKYDFLLTEVQDKITQTIKFLQEEGIIEKDLTLKEVYDKYLHPDVLDIDREDVWKNIQENKILNVFQFDSDVGSQAAKKIKPSNMIELADANGLMRLMTAEKGAETPMEKYIRFKNNLDLWYKEMELAGLTQEEMKTLEPYFKSSFGVPPSQEQLMKMLMDPDICSFTLKEANAARKVVGKKQMNKIPELREKVLTQAASTNLGRYVWKCGIGPQMGYSFSVIHALAYSFIGYQTAFLATNWNPIYWDTACLVVNSGSLEEDEEEIVSIYEKEDEEYTYTDLKDRTGKKKEKTSDYAKIAKAIGDIVSTGIEVSLVNINESDYGFKPDIENNRILYGLKALSNVNAEAIEKIKSQRPYLGIKDFMNRCPLQKKAMISLIKAGAFDEVEKVLPDRRTIMAYYLMIVSEPKKRLTLQNFNGLINAGLIPQKFTMQVRCYNFNKYARKYLKYKEYYKLDEQALQFFEKFIPELLDMTEQQDNNFLLKQSIWDMLYQANMDRVREWLQENQKELLQKYNEILFKEIWDKYAEGTTSAWEMDSLCFYHGPHELANVSADLYGFRDFFELDPNSEVERFWKRGKNKIPIYKLCTIIGTVISKNDNKSTISLLTTSGVVTVKFTRDQYSKYKKQISIVQADGKKKVMEKGWFTRGTKLLLTGFRRDDMFVVKTYSSTKTHQIYKITNVNEDGTLELQSQRYDSVGAIEEEV